MTRIELKLGPKTFRFDCERIEQGVAINPVLPKNFDCTSEAARPLSHLAWWCVPYILEERATGPEWCKERGVPLGTLCYTLRCFNGGSHDRSTWCGVFPSLAIALEEVPNATKDYGQAARNRSFKLAEEARQNSPDGPRA